MKTGAVVGVAGIGHMGSAIAGRLLECGVATAIWNRSSERQNELIARGAVAYPTPAALASACEIVITVLLDDLAVDSVYLGPGGLLSGNTRERLFIDTSTVQPATAVRIAGKAKAVGASFVDAPVIGTVGPARAGQLIVVAGGSSDEVTRAKYTLDHIARVVHHVGGVGTGAAMKVAVNILMTTYWAAMSESFAIAQACGLDSQQLAAIISDSPAALSQLGLKLPILLGQSKTVAFDIDAILRNCDVMLQLAATHKIELPTIEAAQSLYTSAAAAGWGDRDVASLPRFRLSKE
jgi:3-hydroxyisobutyrate dehydrogenase